MNIDRDAIKTRLEAMRDAASRSRFALLVSTIAALSVLIACFNCYLSWNREFALENKFADTGIEADKGKAGDPITIAKERINDNTLTGLVTGPVQRQLLNDWVSSTSMNITLLGIRVNVADATVLGGIALFFLTLWFSYSMRRENRLVWTLLRDTRDADLGTMDLAFSGIISRMVFTAVRPDKQELADLRERPLAKRQDPGPAKIKLTLIGAQLLFFLPPVAIFLSLVFDILSLLYFAAPFRREHAIPWPGSGALVKLILFVIIGLICLWFTLNNCRRIHRLDKATGNILREYGDLLKGKRLLVNRLMESPGEDLYTFSLPGNIYQLDQCINNGPV